MSTPLLLRCTSALTAMVALWVFASPARANPCADPGGIGGTGISDASRSAALKDDPGGIGGTGIVGTITGFGSICANGIEIHYDYRTRIEGGSVTLRRPFAIGQVVAVEASGAGQEVNATRIAILHEVSGTITAVDHEASRIQVMGRAVDVSRVRSIADSKGTHAPVEDLKPGDFVRVSGLRRPDSIVEASHIARDRNGTASVAGRLTRGASDETVSIEGVAVQLPADAALAQGSEVRVTGRWNGKALVAKSVIADPVGKLLEGLPRLELQGYAHLEGSGQQLRLWGRTVNIETGTRFTGGNRSALGSGRKVRISIRVDAGRLMSADHIIFEPERRENPQNGNRGTGSGSDDSAEEGNAGKSAGQDETQQSHPANEWGENKGGAGNGGIEDKVEKADRPENPGKAERPEKFERPDRVERPDKIERPERIERPQKPEKPSKPERR